MIERAPAQPTLPKTTKAARPRLAARKLAKPLVFAFGLLPLGRVAWDALHGQLGANPIAEVLNRFGFWTLFFLCASLVPTPLKLLFGLKWPLALRRMVGLFAFTYALLHFA